MTPNFSLTELTATNTGLPNEPSVEIRERLYAVACILETIRLQYDRPIVVTSGWRSDEVNVAVGGVPNSSHVSGYAVDFRVAGVPLDEVYLWIRDNLSYDQLIREPTWVHLDISPRMRQMAWVV